MDLRFLFLFSTRVSIYFWIASRNFIIVKGLPGRSNRSSNLELDNKIEVHENEKLTIGLLNWIFRLSIGTEIALRRYDLENVIKKRTKPKVRRKNVKIL